MCKNEYEERDDELGILHGYIALIEVCSVSDSVCTVIDIAIEKSPTWVTRQC